MNRIINLLICFALISNILSAQSSEPVKRALIIAIGDYPTDSTGWPRISSINDIELVKSALLYQKFTDIAIIQDKQATKQGIVNAIKKLESNLKPGDIAIIHFSCHGQQIQDYNKDEIDSLDEAIVPYDAPVDKLHASNIGFTGDYKNENHFTDDEFGDLMDEIRLKLGPNGDLVVFIDACHSGTGTRGEAKVRGGFPAFVSKDYIPMSSKDNKEVFLFQNENNPALAHYVVYTASRAEELNREISFNKNGFGSLSWAMSKALKECANGSSYRGLFAQIQSSMFEMVPSQHPTIEGDVDRELFKGKVVAQQPYLTIDLIKSENSIIINGGKLAGIYDSTKVALYKPGTIEIKNAQPIATGYVKEADYLTSTVVFPGKINLKNKTDAWVFIIEKSFPDVRVKVSLGSFNNKNLKNLVENYLNTSKISVKTELQNSDLIIEQSKKTGISILSLRNAQGGSNYLDSIAIDSLDKYILRYVQAKFIRGLDVKNSDYRIDLTFTPIKKYIDSKKIDTLKIEDYTVNGTIEFPVGTSFIVNVKNNGSKTCYFSILDIYPNGVVDAVAPSIKQGFIKPDGYFKLYPGGSMYLPYSLKVSPPYGQEMYKVFASENFIDLSFIVKNNGTIKRGDTETPLEKIFRLTYDNNSIINKRGAGPDDLPLGNFGTTDVPFVIKP